MKRKIDQDMEKVLFTRSGRAANIDFIVASGEATQMFQNDALFLDSKASPQTKVSVEDGRRLKAVSRVSVFVGTEEAPTGKSRECMALSNVLFVP